MRVFSSIIHPALRFPLCSVPDRSHRGTVGSQIVCYDDFWPTIPLHRFCQENKGRRTIPSLRDIGFKYLTFMINSPPKVVCLAVDFYEHLVQVPLPVRMSAEFLNPFLPDL